MGSTFSGTAVSAPTPATPSSLVASQIFCTLEELATDLNLNGAEREALIWPKIKAASQFLQEELGWFIPVTLARTLQGSGEAKLYMPQGLLSVTSVVDDGNTLVADTDYYKMPRQPLWPNGPYTWLEVGEDATLLNSWCRDKDGVVITGKWGKYNLSKDTGADVGTGGQSSSATSLLVDNGSKLSPGSCLLIGTEQQLVTATGSPTDSTANLGAAITDKTEEVITVSDGTQLNVGEEIRVDLEHMKVLDIASNSVYVARGWNKSKLATHSNAADVYVYRTFTVERAVNGTTAAAHEANTDISRYVVPDDVNFLARQIAGKMLKLAQSAFAGRVGDSMTGEAIYNFAFPRDELERIKRNYMIHTAA